MATISFTYLFLLAFAVVSFVAWAQLDQEDPFDADFVTNTGLADYIDCITTNPGCIDCDAESDPSIPDFSDGGGLPSTNDDIQFLFCDAVNCCSACTEQSKALFQCSANAICSAFGIEGCSLECSPEQFPYGDSDTIPDECDQAVGAFTSCLIRDGSCLTNDDERCLDRLNNLNATATDAAFGLANNCAYADAFFCTYVDCCPTCQAELLAVYECEANSLDICELTCTDAVANGSGTGSGTTNNPAPTTSTATDPPASSPTFTAESSTSISESTSQPGSPVSSSSPMYELHPVASTIFLALLFLSNIMG
jgi:hypothetical protein